VWGELVGVVGHTGWKPVPRVVERVWCPVKWRLSSVRESWRDVGKLGHRRLAMICGVGLLWIAFMMTLIFVRYLWLIMYLLTMGGLALMAFVHWISELGVRRAVNEHGGLICWQCWYPLGAVVSDRCPECGTAFMPEALVMKWDKALKKWK